MRLRVAEARATARSAVQHALSSVARLSDSLEAELGLGLSTSLEDVLLGGLGDPRGSLAAPERLTRSACAASWVPRACRAWPDCRPCSRAWPWFRP